jgi:hypothetical protein
MCFGDDGRDSDAAPEAWFPSGSKWAEAVTGIMALRRRCWFEVTAGRGVRRRARSSRQ